MKCRICGAELKDNSKFCENCGAKVETENTGSSSQESFERVDGEVVSEHHFKQNDEGQSEYTTETNTDNRDYSYSGSTGQSSYSSAGQSQSTGSYSNAGSQGTAGSFSQSTNSAASNNKNFAIASLACGIVSIICCCCCAPLNFILGGAAVGLGIYVLKQELPGKEMAIAGIVCGGVGLLMFLTGVIVNVSGLTSSLTDGIDLDDITEFIEDL